jgi:hypothetical protein
MQVIRLFLGLSQFAFNFAEVSPVAPSTGLLLCCSPIFVIGHCAAEQGGWMPKVSTQVQRRIAALDAKYTVAQPKRPGRGVVALLAIIAVASAASPSARIMERPQ